MNTKLTKPFFILVLVLTAFSCFAQEALKGGEVTINNRKYTVTKKPTIGGYRICDNIEFIQKLKENPRKLFRLEWIEFTNTKTPKSVFVDILGEKRVKELAKGKGVVLPIYLYPNYTGSIQAIEFRLLSDHILTIEELDRLFVSLKNNLSFKMPGNLTPNHMIFPITYVIHFKNLIRDNENSK